MWQQWHNVLIGIMIIYFFFISFKYKFKKYLHQNYRLHTNKNIRYLPNFPCPMSIPSSYNIILVLLFH